MIKKQLRQLVERVHQLMQEHGDDFSPVYNYMPLSTIAVEHPQNKTN